MVMRITRGQTLCKSSYIYMLRVTNQLLQIVVLRIERKRLLDVNVNQKIIKTCSKSFRAQGN